MYVYSNINYKYSYDLMILFVDKWQNALNGENFIFIHSETPSYVVVGTLESLKMLCSAEHILVDGTFKSLSELFTQLYSVLIYASQLIGQLMSLAVSLFVSL